MGPTKEEYEAAIISRDLASYVIDFYHREKAKAFELRWFAFLRGEGSFSDDELVYSAKTLCKQCNAGLAYPKDCGVSHQWSCSLSLKGSGEEHQNFPFMYYEIKSEDQPSAGGSTTRPPKETGTVK